MTQKLFTEEQFAEFASQMARNPHTLAAFRELMKDAERKQEISDRIVRLRKRRGLTQPQVAERMGMARRLRTYQNWEAGGGTSHENYERLADVLGCSYDYLVTGGDTSPPADDILARLHALTNEVLELRKKSAANHAELLQAVQSQAQSGKPRRSQPGSGGVESGRLGD